ncbi:unnamed protein product [Effrenium voratum]|nr:unnamed protein product [Effrenium voratum]
MRQSRSCGCQVCQGYWRETSKKPPRGTSNDSASHMLMTSRSTHIFLSSVRCAMGRVFQAACACAGVEIKSFGGPMQLSHCWCNACRAATGNLPSVWAAYPLSQTLFTSSKTLRLFRSGPSSADRYFCSGCGSSVAMLYHRRSVWPEKHTVWLARHFANVEQGGFDEVHVYQNQDDPSQEVLHPDQFVMPAGPRQDQGSVAPVASGEEACIRIFDQQGDLPFSRWVAVSKVPAWFSESSRCSE